MLAGVVIRGRDQTVAGHRWQTKKKKKSVFFSKPIELWVKRIT